MLTIRLLHIILLTLRVLNLLGIHSLYTTFLISFCSADSKTAKPTWNLDIKGNIVTLNLKIFWPYVYDSEDGGIPIVLATLFFSSL